MPRGRAASPAPPDGPSGTALHELACLEASPRAAAIWTAANATCTQFSRRLAALAELRTYRVRAALNPPTTGSEWSGDTAGAEGAARGVVLAMGTGVPDVGTTTATLPFRCVVPATVG